MENHAAVTRTIVISVLTLCCSTVCCATGIYAVADQGRTVDIGPVAGLPLIFLGILVWIVPPLLWLVVAEDSVEYGGIVEKGTV